jgi:MerR family mercuric resistance operon transcriptional regulator
VNGLRTSQVAEAAGVNVQTLRYYERRGLLAEPARTLGGHRLYPPETVTVLRVIKAAQRLGFTLDEVAELLDMGPGLQARAETKLTQIEARITDLGVIRESLLAAMAAGCDDLVQCTHIPGCPLAFAQTPPLSDEDTERTHRFG